MTKFYVYTLAYPPEMGGGVFYVGKGQGGRMHQHEVNAATGETGPRADVIRAVWETGHQIVKAVIYLTDDEGEAFRAERDAIQTYKTSGKLVNIQGMMSDCRRTTLTLRPDLGAKLEAMAAERGISVNAMVAWIIAEAAD